MQYVTEPNRICVLDETGRIVAALLFPDAFPGVVEITHTCVEPSLRDQGIAARMMELLALKLRAENRQARAVCSYAQKWFSEHPEYADVYLPGP
jgi:predicted GNAT family acetyltransferase